MARKSENEVVEMETIEEQMLEGLLRSYFRKYYAERVDNIVLAFGIAGERILRSIKPIQERRTIYKAIQEKKDRAFIGSSRDSQGCEIMVEGPQPLSVQVLSKEEYDYRKRLEDLELWDNPLDLASVTVDFVGPTSDYDSLAAEVMNGMEKSNSFVLVSAFGGTFAQSLHMATARLLRKMKIAHINVILEPGRGEMEKRRTAESGINKLREEGEVVKVFDSQKILEASYRIYTEIGKIYEKLNEKIAKEVEIISDRLASSCERERYRIAI
ncbi:hypothetical protein ApAK_02535 [Thermoplasmatales archaeon AK]|nr:hypothetical protein [Thermoplasmatales archaeon AK]